MPFRSEAQRRKFYAMSSRGEISPSTVSAWESATPKGKKLPERVVKKAYETGYNAALRHFGLKQAGEEIRLKIPKRQFHGYDDAWRSAADRGQGAKQADAGASPLEPQASPDQPAEILAQLLQQIDAPPGAGGPEAPRNPLDRHPIWGGATNPDAGDTASREPDFNTGGSSSAAF